MKSLYHIQKHCRVQNGAIWQNGTRVYHQEDPDFKTFAKAAYKAMEMDYSKFFKMDNLSKLAFMASDLLLASETEKNTALVLSNRAGSLDTDRSHQGSIENEESYYPSPAVFVYTLPNICLGEISIKHQLFSENAFFVFDEFQAGHLHDYACSLLDMDKAEKVLCGWVDVDHEKYDAFLYVVAKSGIFTHSKEKINQLYQTTWQI